MCHRNQTDFMTSKSVVSLFVHNYVDLSLITIVYVWCISRSMNFALNSMTNLLFTRTSPAWNHITLANMNTLLSVSEVNLHMTQ